MAEPKWKNWGSVDDFLRAKTKRVTHEHDWTAMQTLYAHYKRWAHLADLGILEVGTFMERMRERFAKTQDVNGHVFLPVTIVDDIQEQDEEVTEKAKPVARGKVRLKRDVQFKAETLTAGTVVDWMAPTKLEQGHLDRLTKGGDAMSWLVVVFNGQRRYLPGDACERI